MGDWHATASVGDALLLRQVFAELMAVALDATQEIPGAVIEVDGELRDGKAVVWVRHNGAKLSAGEAEEFFSVFRAPRSGLGAGDRIGPANARRIVARHGGRYGSMETRRVCRAWR
ncbi:ATP-binding protein [Deinococcus peraridilitoris]|uniref:ATP-binding protein n=1 Tax=Deinococcus peraridilitoris TaxID=432329 RepID=UPI00031B4430|nr:ATP-binding protein [Deinococcus peraridilitoris]